MKFWRDTYKQRVMWWFVQVRVYIARLFIILAGTMLTAAARWIQRLAEDKERWSPDDKI